MTILFTDSGTRANGALGANYTTTTGMDTLVISSNRFIPNNSANDAFQFVNSVSFTQSRQYAKAVTSGIFTNGGVGAGMAVGVKFDTGAANTGIRLAWDASGWELGRFNAGTFTSLASASLTIADGDVMLIDYNGSTGAWLVQRNGTTVVSGSGTDGSPIASGAAGVGYSSVGNAASGFINFEAGDFAAAISGWQLPIIRPALPDSPFYKAWITRPRPINSASGPTQYLQSVAGTLNFAGGLVKQVGKLAAGSVNFAGALVKQVNKIVAGSVNFAGALAATRVVLLAVSGSVGFAGAVTKRALKNTAGSVNFAGGLVKQTTKIVAGTVNFAGGLIKQVGKLLGGTVNFSGALATTKVVLLSLSGTVGFSGGLTKQTNKIVAGSVNFAGACKKGVAHAVSGTVNFSGGLLKQVNKITAGVVSFAGSLATLNIPGGTTFTQAVGGTLSFIGTVATSKIPFGAVVSDWIMRIRRRRR